MIQSQYRHFMRNVLLMLCEAQRPCTGGARGYRAPWTLGRGVAPGPRSDVGVCRVSYVHAYGQIDAALLERCFGITEAYTDALIVLRGCNCRGSGGALRPQRGA